jgi:hypothetical protein
LLVSGVGVLDADALRGLLFAGLLPHHGFRGRGVLLRLWWRCLHLFGELPGQSPAAGIHLRLDVRISLEQTADPLGPHCRLVVHAAGPERPGPQGPALLIGDDGGLTTDPARTAPVSSRPAPASGEVVRVAA